MKKFGIVGYGHVGRAMHRLLGSAVVSVYDPHVTAPEALNWGKVGVNEADCAIVCVPTQEREDGSADTTIIDEVIGWIDTPLILIKSTVPVGTTDRLVEDTGKAIAMSPEYFGESPYYTPEWWSVEGWPFLIVGGKPETTQAIVRLFVPLLGPTKQVWQTDARTAEFVKYIENMWGAMKVIWANQMRDAADALGVSYEQARELWALDPRVEAAHTAVFDDNRGYGGKCFPKDVASFIYQCREAGIDPTLMAAVESINRKYQGD